MFRRLTNSIESRGVFTGAVFPVGAGVRSLDEIEPPIMQDVSESTPAVEADATPDRTISNILVQVLMAVTPQAANLVQERDELLSLAVPLAERIEAYVAAVAEESRQELREQYRNIREEGRKQEEVCARALVDFHACQAEWNSLRQTKEAARFHVVQANNQAKPRTDENPSGLSRFANDREITAARNALTRDREALTKATQEESAALQERNRMAYFSNAEQAKLARIVAETEQIKAQLTGAPFRDPETGLEVHPISRRTSP